ncbi:hypothetical protein RIF29_28703 [Crotalaria pallida]|uniref:Uncharacterized protein n=1 Tax=Crotalaria pallida TaxID=3830 RepID=A0AAN9HZM1_CROPI
MDCSFPSFSLLPASNFSSPHFVKLLELFFFLVYEENPIIWTTPPPGHSLQTARRRTTTSKGATGSYRRSGIRTRVLAGEPRTKSRTRVLWDSTDLLLRNQTINAAEQYDLNLSDSMDSSNLYIQENYSEIRDVESSYHLGWATIMKQHFLWIPYISTGQDIGEVVFNVATITLYSMEENEDDDDGSLNFVLHFHLPDHLCLFLKAEEKHDNGALGVGSMLALGSSKVG